MGNGNSIEKMVKKMEATKQINCFHNVGSQIYKTAIKVTDESLGALQRLQRETDTELTPERKQKVTDGILEWEEVKQEKKTLTAHYDENAENYALLVTLMSNTTTLNSHKTMQPKHYEVRLRLVGTNSSYNELVVSGNDLQYLTFSQEGTITFEKGTNKVEVCLALGEFDKVFLDRRNKLTGVKAFELQMENFKKGQRNAKEQIDNEESGEKKMMSAQGPKQNDIASRLKQIMEKKKSSNKKVKKRAGRLPNQPLPMGLAETGRKNDLWGR